MTRAEFVRALLRKHPKVHHAPVPATGQSLTPSERIAFGRGYRAGVAFALSLLPAEGDMSESWIKGIRSELEDRA